MPHKYIGDYTAVLVATPHRQGYAKTDEKVYDVFDEPRYAVVAARGGRILSRWRTKAEAFAHAAVPINERGMNMPRRRRKKNDIRGYGPGKFDTIVDSVVYDLSLDGCDEEAGDVSEVGWHACLLRGSLYSERLNHVGQTLNRDELGLLKASKGGAIIEENDQGFVSVSYYTSKKAIDEAWKLIEESEQAEE